MAALRACSIALAVGVFFLVVTPIQWLIARLVPSAANRIPLIFCRTLLGLLRVRVSVSGTRVVERPIILVANHVSWIDILALGAQAPFCFLAKSELADWPIVSAFAGVQGTVFVDRRRRRSIPLANQRMAQRMIEGRSILLFPEGTTGAAQEPGPFRSSHFAAARDFLRRNADTNRAPFLDVDIQPVAIVYSARHAAWVGDDSLVAHLWRVLRAPPLRCDISFAPPIAVLADTNRKHVAVQSRASVIDLLKRNHATRSDVLTAPLGDGAPDLVQVTVRC